MAFLKNTVIRRAALASIFRLIPMFFVLIPFNANFTCSGVSQKCHNQENDISLAFSLVPISFVLTPINPSRICGSRRASLKVTQYLRRRLSQFYSDNGHPVRIRLKWLPVSGRFNVCLPVFIRIGLESLYNYPIPLKSTFDRRTCLKKPVLLGGFLRFSKTT